MSRLRLLLLSTSLAITACAAAPKPVTPIVVGHAPVKDPHTEPAPLAIDRGAVRAKLATRRAIVIDRFLAYREARVYPINDRAGNGFAHVWIDSQGHLCAAATLASLDLGREAAIAAAGTNIELALADVSSGPLADWMLTTGLAHHELVAIQVPGWQNRRPIAPIPAIEDPAAIRAAEVQRLYQIYVDVERQLQGLAGESLDQATDALMAHPDLARTFLAGASLASR